MIIWAIIDNILEISDTDCLIIDSALSSIELELSRTYFASLFFRSLLHQQTVVESLSYYSTNGNSEDEKKKQSLNLTPLLFSVRHFGDLSTRSIISLAVVLGQHRRTPNRVRQ